MTATQAINNHAVIVLASGLSQRLGQPKQLLCKDNKPLICYMIEVALATKPLKVIVVIAEGQTATEQVIIDSFAVVANQAQLSQTPASVKPKHATQHPILGQPVASNTNATIHLITNPTPQAGMGHSLRLGIRALQSIESCESLIDRVLIMGVDQVLLDTAHLQQLLVPQYDVVASQYAGFDERLDIKTLKNGTLKNETCKSGSGGDKHQTAVIGLPIAITYQRLIEWRAKLKGDKGLRHLIRALAPNQLAVVNNTDLSYDIDTPAQLAIAQAQGWID